MIAEGGTGIEHSVSIARSDHVTGPYETDPRNPVLTHRHLSLDYPITGVGHADLVALADGRWYAVALGWRPLSGQHAILGRETFLVPVRWETEREYWRTPKRTWPVFSPDSGRVESQFPLPFPGTRQTERTPFIDHFDAKPLALDWNFRRPPAEKFYDLDAAPGVLRLKLLKTSIGENESYSFIGIRQRDFHFQAQTKVRFEPKSSSEEAGLVIIQKDNAAFLLTVSQDRSGPLILLQQRRDKTLTLLAKAPLHSHTAFLRIDGLGPVLDGTILSPAVMTGFNYTGAFIGLYASSNHHDSQNYADFAEFDYLPIKGQD